MVGRWKEVIKEQRLFYWILFKIEGGDYERV
jgi:hypothetical protein